MLPVWPENSNSEVRDHGGNLDEAIARFGGDRGGWLDLSTGINPCPYPVGQLPESSWNSLPGRDAARDLVAAARRFWRVPDAAAVLAVPGASAAIAAVPRLIKPASVSIEGPTYNEHEAAFRAAGWQVEPGAACRVAVHPNNPDGRFWEAGDFAPAPLTVIDESFCDLYPDRSLIGQSTIPGRLILKSFGKFWGLAGLRLGFVIGDPGLVSAIADMLGPWPVSGPALQIGRAALSDAQWAAETRARLARDAKRLDAIMAAEGIGAVGGTDLFRLYEAPDAKALQERLARGRVWTRIFPYSDRWTRLGLPGTAPHWAQLEGAL